MDKVKGPPEYHPPAPPPPPIEGYQLENSLGTGGFASVYRGVRESDGRVVAVKVSHRNTPDVQTRFTREAEALARIGPPHVPELIDAGQLPDGRPFIAMELIEGKPLSAVLEKMPSLPPLSWVCHISTAILRGLAAAHAQGVVHRDLKPENLIINGEPPSVRLIDFGLVRGEGLANPELTHTGHILGTPEYSAPEQLRSGGDVGPATDIYAFGVILYELLTLRPPFSGHAAGIEHGHLALRPPRPSSFAPVPGPVDDIVISCLAKDPAERPKEYDRLIRRIIRAFDNEDSSERSVAAVTHTGPVLKRSAAPLRTDGKRPVVLLCIYTTAGASEVMQRIAAQGGILVRQTGTRYLAAFPGLEVSDPVAAAHGVAASLMLDYGAYSAIHLESLRIRKQKRGRMAVYGKGVEKPEVWLPKNEWAGAVVSSEIRPAIRQGTLLPVEDQPEFFYWDRESDESDASTFELIGRTEQMEALKEAARRCFNERIPTLCTVVAEGGMGKSRLAREFSDYLVKHTEAQRAFLHARHPIAAEVNETVRDLLRIGLKYERERAPADIRALCLNKLGSEVGNSTWRAVASALGWTSEAARHTNVTAIRQAIQQGLIRRAHSGPFVLILDDAHWAEDTVLEALEQCAGTASDVPLLIAMFAHPMLEQNREGTRGAMRAHTRIVLDPLSKEDSLLLARSLLRDVHRAPLEALDRLAQWAGGSPFMMEELVRGLRQEGLIRVQEGTQFKYLAAELLGRLPSSPANQWLVERELSAMPPELSDLTRLCAVLGTDFTLEEIQAIQNTLEREGSFGGPVAAAHFGLGDLVQRKILNNQDNLYAFRAPALRDAVYDLVDADAKTKLHEHALNYWRLNTKGTGLDCLQHVAYHSRGAGQASLARHCYLALALDARKRNAYLQAEEHYRFALELMDESHGVNYVETLIARGGVRRNLSKYEHAMADFALARELAIKGNFTSHLVEVIIAEAGVYDFLENYSESTARIREAQEHSPDNLPPRVRAQVDNWAGVQLFREGKWVEAAERMAQAAMVAEVLGEHATRVGSMLLLAGSLWCNGQKEEADRVQQQVLQICEDASDYFHLTVGLANEVEYLIAAGKLKEAQAAAERCCQLAVDHGFETWEMIARRNLIWLHVRHGEIDHAVNQGRAAYQQCQLRHGSQMPPTVSIAYAFALALAGNADEASQLVADNSVQDENLEPSIRMMANALRLHLGQPVDMDWSAIVKNTRAVESPMVGPADIFWLMARTNRRDGSLDLAKENYSAAIEAASEQNPVYAAILETELKGLDGGAPSIGTN